MTIQEVILRLISAESWKVGVSVVGAFLMEAFLPMSGFLAAIGLMVVFDWLTGVRASMIEGARFQSKRMIRTVDKLISYGLAIIIAQLIQSLYLPSLPITYGVSSYIVAIEVQSIRENLKRITGIDVLSPLGRLIENLKNRLK